MLPLFTAQHIWDSVPEATVILAPLRGRQVAHKAFESPRMSRISTLLTWTSWLCTMLPHHKVCETTMRMINLLMHVNTYEYNPPFQSDKLTCAAGSRPSISASSSSSSMFRPRTLVCPTKLSKMYVSCSSAKFLRDNCEWNSWNRINNSI